MDADERAALLADFARQNDRLRTLNARYASQDDLAPRRSAMLLERQQVHARIAEIRTRLGNVTAGSRALERQATDDVLRDAREVNTLADAAIARARRIQSNPATADARDENISVDAALESLARQRADRELRARDENSRVAAIARARASGGQASPANAQVLRDGRDSNRHTDALQAAMNQILSEARQVNARSRANREARAADAAAWSLEHAANANELQRRARAGNDRRPPADADPARGAELAWRDGINSRRAAPSRTPHVPHHRFQRPHDPAQAARAALRPWAAAAADEDMQNAVPEDDKGRPIIPDGQECCFCMVRPRTVFFLPCGHSSMCAVCWNKMLGSSFAPECQLCKRPVEKAERLSPSQLQTLSQGGEIRHDDVRPASAPFVRLGARLP